ncbi:MAG TPA: ABATE domain-containing protein [Chloroflexota bacterium]
MAASPPTPARGPLAAAAGTSSANAFELDAGRLCLDFANTLSASSGEHLQSYADLVAFAAQSDSITPHEAGWLRAEAAREPAQAEHVLTRARRLRAAIYAIFSALAAGRVPPESEVNLLNGDLAASLAHARVVPDAANPGGFRWGWSGPDLHAPLWPISRSAADLLISEQERALVRECGADPCRWLFLDTSRNRTRQWCSMQSCGNREKARRHYQRLREQRGGASSAAADSTSIAARGDAQPAPRPGGRKRVTPSGGANATAG